MSDQSSFRTALLDPGQQAPTGLIDGAGHGAGRRFEVYRNNVAVALGDALLAGFPVTAKILGEQNFKSLAAIHLRQSPPHSPIIAGYGDDFPNFLKGFPPLSHLGYLQDIAQLECLLRSAYHAADATALDPACLQQISADDLGHAVLTLAPSMRRLSSPWPIHDIWRFNTTPDAPQPVATAQDIAIFRPDYDPVPELLPAGGHAFLSGLLDGAPLEQAANAALADAPNFDLTALLGLLLANGAITDIHINFHTR